MILAAGFGKRIHPLTLKFPKPLLKISNETGMTQQQVFDVIQKTLDTITQTLAAGDEVVLRNFGSFQVKETKQKIGRNPNKPGTDVIIPPRAIVKFKPGKEMKERVATVLPQIQNSEEPLPNTETTAL